MLIKKENTLNRFTDVLQKNEDKNEQFIGDEERSTDDERGMESSCEISRSFAC